MSPPTRITLIRHGETRANVDGVWHGSTDTALTERGRAQAARTALHVARTRPDVDRIFASPLERARHTAEALGDRLDLPIAIEADLREYDLGAWEGRTYRELGRDERLFERMAEDPDWRPGEGESARGVAERIGGALARLARDHAGEHVAVITHGGGLTLALGWLVDGDASEWRRVVHNASVSQLVFDPEPRLRRFNEVAHLGGLG